MPTELSDADVFGSKEMSDDEVFGRKELSDADVFGGPQDRPNDLSRFGSYPTNPLEGTPPDIIDAAPLARANKLRQIGAEKERLQGIGEDASRLADVSLMTPVRTGGEIARGAVADIASGLSGAPEYSGNLPAALGMNPLPIDATLADISKEAPGAATLGKISQGLAASAPLIAVMPQGAIGKLIAAGFTADMLHGASKEATALGEEMGKNPEDRDYDKITSALSGLTQAAAFAPLTAVHAGGKAIGERVAPRAEAIRELANQLKSEPLSGRDVTIADRRLGIKMPQDVGMGQAELADQALKEAQNPMELNRVQTPAIDLMRLNEQDLVLGGGPAHEFRPGGGRTVGGKVSFERPAEDLAGIERKNALQSQGSPVLRSLRNESRQSNQEVPSQGAGKAADVGGDQVAPTQIELTQEVKPLTRDEALRHNDLANRIFGEKSEKMTEAEMDEFDALSARARGESGPGIIKEGEQHLNDAVKDQGIADKVNMVGPEELTLENPMTYRIAQFNLGTGKIDVNGRAFADALANVPKELRGKLAKVIMNEENIHSFTSPQDAFNFGKNLSWIEKKIGDRIYTGKWSGEHAGANLNDMTRGFEVMRRRIQRLNRMSPTEVVRAAGREKWTVESLDLLDRAVAKSREFFSGEGSKGKQNLEAINRVQKNLDTVRQSISGGAGLAGNSPASLKPEPLKGERLVELVKPDGSTETVAYGDKFYDLTQIGKGKIPSIARWTGNGWSHGMAGPGEFVREMQSPAAPGGPSGTPPTTPVPPANTPGGSPVTLDDIYKIFEPTKKPRIGLKQRVVNTVEAFRTGVSSKFRPVNKLAEDIGKAYGRTSNKDIAGIMEQLKGSSGKAEADVYRFDKDVSDLVKGDEKDFNAYMFLKRTADRLVQDQADIAAGLPARRKVSTYTMGDIQPKLQLLEQKLGPDKLQKFEDAAQQYQNHMDRALRLQVESGRMSNQVYQAIKNSNQFYAPFKVMKYIEEQMRPEGSGKRIDTLADYTKAMEGIEDPNLKLGDMLAAGRHGISMSRILSDKNIAMRHVAELAAFDPNGLFIKKLPKGVDAPKGMQAVNVLEHGNENRYAVNPDVAEAIQLYGGNAGGVISRVLSAFSIPFKAGATAFNIPFQGGNLLIADQPRLALLSKYGIKNPADFVRYPMDLIDSFFKSMGKNVLGIQSKLMLDFLDSGVAGTTVQEHLTPDALKFKEPNTISKSRRLAESVLFSIPRFAKAIEETSKVMGVKRAMRIEGVSSGKELARQVPEAITELRRFSGSPDFGRQGKWVEQARLNLLYMFLNARIQGTVADVGRLGGRDGAGMAAKSWLKIGTAVGIPTAYLYYLNQRPEYKDDYDKRPTQEKQNYWLIPKDTFIVNEDGERMRDFWRIPKRESAKWIANLTESALDFAHKRDPKAAADFGSSMLGEISPVNIQGNNARERIESVASSLNPLIKAPLELATGRDLYRHRDLIPDTMQKASPEQQYTQRTAEAFKTIAEHMPAIAPEFMRSPILLDNMTRNLTAGLFTQFLPRKPMEGRTGIENTPLLSRFQALPYTDNEASKQQVQGLEREAADEYLKRHREAMKLIDDNKGKDLNAIVDKIASKKDIDEKLLNHVVDLWIAKENGITATERSILALPVRQRAIYVNSQLKGLSEEAQNQKFLDLARKRIITEQVMQAMGDDLK